jgi:RNA binding exosome subunit
VNNDVVQLIQGMAGDRQAKLFKEFKGDKEKKILNDLLDQIRRGNQEDLLRDAKEKLDQASYVRPDNEARTE